MSSSTQQINNSFVRTSSSPHSSNQSSNNTNNNKSSLVRKNSSLTEVHQHPENENRYCPADHLLVKDAPPAFICDCCTRSYPAGSESYACRTCFYDCCLRCYCAPTCRGRHILAKGHVGLKFACDLCAKIYAAGSSAHSCREDNFDVCDSCYDQVVQVRLNERMKANVNNASTVTVKRGLFASSGGIQNQNMAMTAKSGINENNHHQAANRPASSPMLSAPKGTKCRSLFIGINYYNSKAELRGSVNDIFTSMKLLRAIGFDLAATKVLTDDRNFIARTGAPDKKSIEASLAWLVDGARNGDHLFFHFAGHATQGQPHHPHQQQKKFSSNDNGVPPSSSSAPFEDCIVPIDYAKAGLISDEYLFDNLFSKIPQGCRLTAIFDTGVWPASFGSHLDFEWNFEESTSSSIKRTTSPRTSPNKNGMFMRFAQTQKSATRDESERLRNLAKFSNNNNNTNNSTVNGGEVCVASNAFSRNSNTGNARTIDFCIPSVGDVLIFSCVRDHLSIPAPEGQDISDYVNQYGGVSPAITLDHDFDDNSQNKFNNNAGRSGSVLLNKSVISSGGIALSLTANLATKIGVDGKPHVSIHEVIFGIQNELEQRGFVDRVLNVSSTKKLDFSGGFSVFGELPTIM